MHTLKVLLIEDDPVNQPLAPDLEKNKFSVVSAKPSISALGTFATKEQIDLVVFNIETPERTILDEIRTLNQHFPIPVIIFATDSNTETINQVVKAGASAYIVDGLETRRIKSIMDVAIARFREQQSLKNELEKTKSKLEERKLIDRAKAILIKTRGFSEDEAYQTLRKLAMNRNITVGEMAKNIIAMEDLFN